MKRLLLACALTLQAHSQTKPVPPRPPADPNFGKLADTLAAIAIDHHGKVALYAEQPNTGKIVTIHADELVQTASTIKLALLWEAMHQVALGKAQWSERLTLKPGDPVGGSGVLRFLDTPATLTLKDAATLMIISSDNTATNLMIDRFPTAQVNADMATLGLNQTVLYKKVFKPATGPMPADQPKFGLGKTTPKQIAELMKHIGFCDLYLPGDPAVPRERANAACATGLEMLRNQLSRDTIPRYLEKLDSSEHGSGIASKTGSLDATRSDVAIVAGKSGPIVMAIYTYENEDHSWTADNEGEVTIAKLAQAVVQAWSPDGIDGAKLKPGLGLVPSPAVAIQ